MSSASALAGTALSVPFSMVLVLLFSIAGIEFNTVVFILILFYVFIFAVGWGLSLEAIRDAFSEQSSQRVAQEE